MRRRKFLSYDLKGEIRNNDLLFEGIKESEALIKLWAVRFLLDGKFLNYFYHKEFYQLQTFLEYFGIKVKDNTELEKIDEILKNLKEDLQTKKLLLPKTLQKNIKALSKIVGLNEAQERILAFFVLVKENELLNETIGAVSINYSQIRRVISIVLDLNYQKVKHILFSTSRLLSSGVIKLDYSYSKVKIDTVCDFMFDTSKLLYAENNDILDIFKEYFRKCSEGSLDMESYSHMGDLVDAMINLVKRREDKK